MRRTLAIGVCAALSFAAAALASDDKAFAELKARFEKAAKKHDDDGIRERRRMLIEFVDFMDQKGARKLLHDALEDEDGLDARVSLIQVLSASGDPKDLDLISKSLAREKLRGPAIAVGEGIACTPPASAAAVSLHALELVPKTKGDLRLSLFEGVGELGDPAAYGPLVALGEKWLAEEHCLRNIALGACGRGQAVASLSADARAGTGLIQLGAVTGLVRTGVPESLPPLVEALRSLDPRVVETAATALGAAKEKSATGALVDALALSPLRVKIAVRTALASIAGKDYGLAPEAWRSALAGKKPEPPVVPASEPKLREFFGIPVASDRVAIVLDISRSMIWNDRLARSVAGINSYVGSLDDQTNFNVFTCARTTERFAKTLVSGPKSRAEAAAWTSKQLTSGGFDLEAALVTILTEEPDADTILLATDSLPWGTSAAETAMEAMEVFRRANQFRRVTLHIAMVVPGGRFTTSETDVDFEDRAFLLKLMAETSGGKFVRVEK